MYKRKKRKERKVTKRKERKERNKKRIPDYIQTHIHTPNHKLPEEKAYKIAGESILTLFLRDRCLYTFVCLGLIRFTSNCC